MAGIDKQVVYPTVFLTTTTDDVELGAALFRTYNSFMAQACSKSNGRIRFVAACGGGAYIEFGQFDKVRNV